MIHGNKPKINPGVDLKQIVRKCSEQISKYQMRLAFWLSLKIEHWSSARKRIFLFIFCLCSGILSGTWVTRGLFEDRGPSNGFTFYRLAVPLHIGKPGGIPGQGTSVVDLSIVQRLNRLQYYLDSLKKNAPDVYQNFMHQRPHFRDSIEWLMKEYLSNNKK